ncbi:MAG: DsbA family protein [Halobacteriaceae archaeon]
MSTRRDFLALAGASAAAVAGCGSPGASLPAPTLGDADAPVTVLAFEDFACPHCRRFALDVLPRLRSEYVGPGTVRYEHHDFPIPVHERWSWRVPSAARAVQAELGEEAFFAYAKRLYEHQQSYSMELLGELAGEAGADPGTVRRAAREETYRDTVEADRRRGRQLGVTGTPAVFVDGDLLDSYAYDAISDAIDSAVENN